MKYAIVIPDGCADDPQAVLGGKTPLQAAHKRHTDRLAQLGVVGLANNVPPGLTPASDVATLSLLVYRAASGPAPFTAGTQSQPPHDIPDRTIVEHLPTGPGSRFLCDLMERSKEVLRRHPVNVQRVARGERPATQVWLWGQGHAPV